MQAALALARALSAAELVVDDFVLDWAMDLVTKD